MCRHLEQSAKENVHTFSANPKSALFLVERDLIGLAGPGLCLFKAEADVEDEINIPSRVLKQAQRFTVHTNLQVGV